LPFERLYRPISLYNKDIILRGTNIAFAASYIKKREHIMEKTKNEAPLGLHHTPFILMWMATQAVA